MNPNSLRLMLVSVVVLLQLISLTVVNVMSSKQLDNQMRLTTTSALQAQANEVVEKTRLFLVPALSQLTVAGQLLADGMLDSRKDEVLASFFRSQLRSNSWLKGMYLAREDGSFVRVGRFSGDFDRKTLLDGNLMITKTIKINGAHREVLYAEHDEISGQIRQWTDAADTYDPRQREWYRHARAAGKLVWSDAFSFYGSDRPNVSASVPVRTPDGRDAGVLSVRIDLQDLSHFIDSTSDNRLSSAVVIDANGRVIAYSAAERARDSALMTDIEAMEQKAGNALLELYRRISGIGMNGSGEDTLVEHLTLGGKNHTGLARSVNLFGGAIDWTLLIARPELHEPSHSDEILHSGMRLAMLIIATPGILALLVILAITAPVYRLHRRATVDQLTRAFNRDEFETRLARQLSRVCNLPAGRQLVIAVLDLDGFKLINDRHGHAAGDAVLKALVKRLRNHLRPQDLVGRLGGDEFAVALVIDKHRDPVQCLEDIRRQVVADPVPGPDGSHCFGMTLGVSIGRETDDVDSVLSRADRALVIGKGMCKNRTYRFSESMPTVALQGINAELDIDSQAYAAA